MDLRTLLTAQTHRQLQFTNSYNPIIHIIDLDEIIKFLDNINIHTEQELSFTPYSQSLSKRETLRQLIEDDRDDLVQIENYINK